MKPHTVTVRVVYGVEQRLLWQRKEPAWHMAEGCDIYGEDYEAGHREALDRQWRNHRAELPGPGFTRS